MAKRPRTERRIAERDARKLVRDRERLAALSLGGARDHPIPVTSSAVIEVRVTGMACPQCEGPYRVLEHNAPASTLGLREVLVRCQQCGTSRTLWFRIVTDEPN